MSACTRQHDRYLPGHRIQVLPAGHSFHVGKEILIPSATEHPLSFARRVLPDPCPHVLQHAGKTPGMLFELDGAERISKGEQVHMRIIESRAYKGAFQIHARILP